MTLLDRLRTFADSLPSRPDDAIVREAIAEIERLTAERDAIRGAMESQDERERQAGIACGILWDEWGCDWPAAVAERIIHLRRERDGAIEQREEESPEPYEDERFCGNCLKDTPHTCYDSGHERDSSGDWRKCHTCGWRWSGLTGRYSRT
jgi:hypothetical protein